MLRLSYRGGGSAGRTNAEIYRTKGVAREAVLTWLMKMAKPPSEAFMERPQDLTSDSYNRCQKGYVYFLRQS